MVLAKKSLTVRAAEAVKKLESTEVLLKIRRELTARLGEVEAEQEAKFHEKDRVVEQGDLEALQTIKRLHAELIDEEVVIRRLDSDMHQALKITQGREAMAAIGQHRKSLASTLRKAMQANAIIEECKQEISTILVARQSAAEFNERLLLDPDVIANVANAIYRDGQDEGKQLMINLGIIDSRRAQSKGQTF